MHKPLQSAVWLFLATLALWAVAAPIASWEWGALGVEWATAAAMLCAVPGLATVGLAGLAPRGGGAVMVAMLCSGLRIFIVGAGALMLPLAFPELRSVPFLLFVAGFYMVTLAIETAILLRDHLRSVAESGAAAGGDRMLGQAG